MKSLRVATLAPQMWKGRAARANDYTALVDEPTRVYHGDRLLGVYVDLLALGVDCTSFASAVLHVDCQPQRRMGGSLSTCSRFVGYEPPAPAKQRPWCGVASLATEMPAEHAVICQFARTVDVVFAKHCTAEYARHEQTAKAVLPKWRLAGSIFTSAIINRDSQLAYHVDRRNAPGCWSALVMLANDVRGGELVCPEYDVAFALRHGALLLFDGRSILHGVAPFFATSGATYRLSVVYHTLSGMSSCR